MSDRVVVMSAGHVRQVSPPSDIYRNPHDPFVASFVGDVNVLPARYTSHDGNIGHFELGSAQLRLGIDRVQASVGEAVDIYIRPVDIPDLGIPKPITVRALGLQAIDDWPTGAGVGINFMEKDASAFTRATKEANT